MTKRVPRHLVQLYGSATAFRREKRRQIRDVERALSNLMLGCSYLPTGSKPVEVMRTACAEVKKALRVQEWGR